MSDSFYPTADYDFLYNLLDNHEKVIDRVVVGNTTAFVLEGTSPSHKRTIFLRETENKEVPFMKATAIMIRLSKMTELLEWYEANRSWKDGGYFEK